MLGQTFIFYSQTLSFTLKTVKISYDFLKKVGFVKIDETGNFLDHPNTTLDNTDPIISARESPVHFFFAKSKHFYFFPLTFIWKC